MTVDIVTAVVLGLVETGGFSGAPFCKEVQSDKLPKINGKRKGRCAQRNAGQTENTAITRITKLCSQKQLKLPITIIRK